MLIGGLSVSACGKTGHLGEITVTPGSAVDGRGGVAFSALPVAVQLQFAADRKACQDQNAVTVPDDMMAIKVLASGLMGAAAVKGTGAANMSQAGLNSAAESLSHPPVSRIDQLLAIRRDADIRQCECLKARGWDAKPRFLASPPEPPL